MKVIIKKLLALVLDFIHGLDKERIRIYNFEFRYVASPGASAMNVTASGLPDGANIVGFSIGRCNNVGFAPMMAQYNGNKQFYVGCYNHYSQPLPSGSELVQIFIFYNFAT